MGTMQMVRTKEVPRAVERANIHDNGTPSKAATIAAITDVSREMNNASRVVFCEAMLPSSDHGVRMKIDSKGSATKMKANNAMARSPRDVDGFLTAPENRTT